MGAVDNPLRRLAELTAEADGLKRILARRVDELGNQDEGPSGWFVAFERALDRVAALCALLSKLDIDQRVVDAAVASARQYGGEVAWAIDEILDGLDLDARQRALVPELVPRVLRLLGDGQAGPPRPWRPVPPPSPTRSPDDGSVTVVGPGDAQWNGGAVARTGGAARRDQHRVHR